MIRFSLPLFSGLLLFPVAIFAAGETKTTSISQISVQRTWCYGDCPIDSVTFNSHGSATYSGFRNAPRNGFFRGALPPNGFSKLVAFLESQNFFELKSEIGFGNIDAPDFLVSAVRDGSSHNVTFRIGGNPTLTEKFEKTLFGVAETISWKRDDAASESGVRGTARRTLTAQEAASFRDRKPPIKTLAMKFAIIWMQPLDRKGETFSTRSDQEGRFEFFAPPGRYDFSASDSNESERRRLDDPLYLAESQTVTVEKGKFAAPVINFRD